jgi:hypothetical protein
MVEETCIIENQKRGIKLSQRNNSTGSVATKKAVDMLVTEGGEGFYKYVDLIGLAKDDNMVVLSSQHHYYYDAEEMNNVMTLVNLKELNQIKQVKDLFNTCLLILPKNSNFIGCFVNNSKTNRYSLKPASSSGEIKRSTEAIENSIVSRFPFMNRLYSFLDSKTNTYMSKRSVSLLLEDYGFKVIDMTDHNGRTFFYSQKIGETYN